MPTTGHRHVHSPEEIALLIAESRDGGLLEPQEQVRLHRALRLGLRSARQLMVPRARLAAVDAGMPFDEVLRVVAASPYSRLPVYRGTVDNTVGILHIKDVVTRYVRPGRLNVANLLRPIVTCPTRCRRIGSWHSSREAEHQAVVVDSRYRGRLNHARTWSRSCSAASRTSSSPTDRQSPPDVESAAAVR